MNEETFQIKEEEQHEEELAEKVAGQDFDLEASEAETAPYRNLWDDPDFPKTEWECTGISDSMEERSVCELCGQQNVRYVHHMHHPQYGDLNVGCICAGKMEGDIERAKQRERRFKSRKVEEGVPYHERYYLKYGDGKRVLPQDLIGTKALLTLMGFDGGELRQARVGRNSAENLQNADQNKGNQMRCSYCGAEISGVEFYRLPDGRMRCTTCSSTVVKTKAEVEEIFRRVVSNLDNFFGATIEVPISIEVVDERKLKKKIGASLGIKDDQSVLILGVAISKRKKYSIILENGAPRISLIATFAHELTHIWQYTHWDNQKKFKKCAKSKRLLIYEGMAKWVEIQYLYLVGETNVARREQAITRNRQDEYGIGFRLYEERYPLSDKAMTCEDTPFMPEKYPLD